MTATEQAVRLAFSKAHREGAIWIRRYGLGDLSTGVARAYRELFPGRRNAPTHRNVEAVLRRMLDAGEIERKDSATFGEMYRLKP